VVEVTTPVLSRLRARVAVTVWFYRQARRGLPAGQEPTTLTRLPQPREAAQTPATPPLTSCHGAGGRESGHDVAAVRGALLRLRGENTDANPWEDSRA
jgi:hypothetical protein